MGSRRRPPQEDSFDADPVGDLLEYLASGEPLNKQAGKSYVSRVVRVSLGNDAYKLLGETKKEYHEVKGTTLLYAWERALLDVLATVPMGKERVDEWLESNRTIGGISGLDDPTEASDPPEVTRRPAEEVKKPRKSDKEEFEALMSRLAARGGKRRPMQHQVQWVSANLRCSLADLTEEDIPGCEALATWMWARGNETEYRRLYDSKRVPAKGFASDSETGLVDDGLVIDKLMNRLKEGVLKAREKFKNVTVCQVRDLQEGPEASRDRDSIRGVSELLEQVAQQ